MKMSLIEKCGIGGSLIVITITIFGVIGWVRNIVQFTKCDFQSPVRAEVLHGIGIIPPIGAVMGWMGIEDGEPVLVKEVKVEASN